MGDPGQHGVVFENLLEVPQDVSFANYVEADSSALVCGALTDEGFIAQVANEENTVEDENDEKDKETTAQPSTSQVMEALNVACLFSYEEGEDASFYIRALEHRLMPSKIRHGRW